MAYEYENQYLNLLEDIFHTGESSDDRTGVGTVSVFGRQIRYKANKPFPLLQTKKIFTKGIIHELLWFIKGDTNIKYLVDNNVHIWDEWADENGDLGPVYGKQWRDWGGDQLQKAIDRIKTHPQCRRNIVSAWNAGELDNMALHPCHCFFQFYVRQNKYLDIHLYQRSADMFLGVPFNMASYALLNIMIAQVTRLNPGEVIHTFGDAHIYKNHFDQVQEQLARWHRTPPDFPSVLITNPNITNINDFTFDDIEIVGYKAQPSIKAPVAV